jgi:hypothetical protein
VLLAILYDLPDIADKILDKSNVDVNLQYKSIDKKSIKTPLIMAISKKYSHITLKILAKPNVDVNLQDEIGNSALIIAISINNIDIIDKILKIPDVNVNIKNNDGNGILYYFDLFLSDSDSINFIKIIATIIIKNSNNNNFSMINYKKKNYNNKPSSNESKLNLKKNLIEPPRNLNFIDINTLEYFKQQNKNNGINKNVLTEIRKLIIDDNQGLIKGHGGTLPNEVCLIPHNLALFFPVQKSCSLYSNEIKFINKKNTRKKLVNIKLKNKTGKILPGGTIISNMIINFKSTYNGKGSQPKNIKDIASFSYSGVITKNYDYLNNNYLKNDNANKYIKKSVKAYENELKNINIELKKILELNIENEEFISFQKTKYFFQYAKLIREMIEIRKKRFIFFLSASQKQAIKEGDTNMLKKINADIMKSHNSEIIEANKIYDKRVRLSNILEIISKFKSNNPNKNIPTLFHIYACRNMLASDLKENSEIYSGKKLTRRQSFSLEYIKTNFNFLKKLDKKIEELSKDKNFMEIKIGEKELYSKILNFYKDFKKLLETKCTVPIWQYNFFNTILETPVNNIEASIAEFKKELEKY